MFISQRIKKDYSVVVGKYLSASANQRKHSLPGKDELNSSDHWFEKYN